VSKRANLSFRPIAAMAAALLICTSWTNAHAQETCERAGIEFGFFNGVQTIFDDAQEVVDRFLPEQYGRTTPDGQPISYTLYYNDTEGWADFVETFEQRLQEHNGVLSQRFELFFSSLQGGGSWWTHITETVPALGNVLTGIGQTFQAFLTNRLVEGTGDPSTAAVSQRHREQIDHAAAMDKGLLLFAHSQGNLFVNQAYDHALTRVGADSVRVVHVAPPSPRQIGNYTLANLDVVINLLRTTGFVLQNTQDILPYAHRPPGLNGQRDFLGHGLLEIYINPLVPSTSAAIRWHVEQAIDELARSRPSGPGGTRGVPLPPYEELPWLGGPQPDPVYNTTPPTHRVDQVQYRGDLSCYVHATRRYIGTYLVCGIRFGADSNTPRTITVTGLNVNGEMRYHGQTTYSRFPRYYSGLTHRRNIVPEEARGWEALSPGTEMRFSTLTYRNQDRHFREMLRGRCYASYPCETPGQIGFLSGTYPGVTTHIETYHPGSSALANQAAIDDWHRSFERHQSDNHDRWLDYLARLRAYDQRQRNLPICAAPASPSPAPEDPPPYQGLPDSEPPVLPPPGQPVEPPPLTAT
jgi:hypothetical protein